VKSQYGEKAVYFLIHRRERLDATDTREGEDKICLAQIKRRDKVGKNEKV